MNVCQFSYTYKNNKLPFQKNIKKTKTKKIKQKVQKTYLPYEIRSMWPVTSIPYSQGASVFSILVIPTP
jgi:hypothetical protein